MRKDALYGGFAYSGSPDALSYVPNSMFLPPEEKGRDVEIRRAESRLLMDVLKKPTGDFFAVQQARIERRKLEVSRRSNG